MPGKKIQLDFMLTIFLIVTSALFCNVNSMTYNLYILCVITVMTILNNHALMMPN